MSLSGLNVGDLALRCREQTLRFLRGEDRDDTFCFELFERAVAHREADAWDAIMTQYRGIVLAYVGQHSAAALLREQDDYWVNRAFQRFWMAVGPDRFGQFHDLPGLLKYLKMCVHSVLLDEVRARRAGTVSSFEALPESAVGTAEAEGEVLGAMAGRQLWQAVLREVQGEPERIVAYQSFVRDLKPAEIYTRFDTSFESVGDVYRIKRNLLDRLRRSAEIRAFLD